MCVDSGDGDALFWRSGREPPHRPGTPAGMLHGRVGRHRMGGPVGVALDGQPHQRGGGLTDVDR